MQLKVTKYCMYQYTSKLSENWVAVCLHNQNVKPSAVVWA